jgi:KUP system potassium uptake protein
MNPGPQSATWRLSLGALGVVFGDIGTSPLYALRACFTDVPGMTTAAPDVLGVLSMIFWSLALVISLKYVGLVLRADHNGEGGVLALMTLVLAERGRIGRLAAVVGGAGLVGCALFFGDGALTPAVSVLSAVEGLEVVTPAFKGAVLPLSVLALLVLFAFQRHGTERVGRLFGPVMILWFVVLAILGVRAIANHPEVLQAIDPRFALDLAVRHAGVALVLFASVFLAVTGGEALYADLGHFGRRPIVRAWLWLVWPALVLNYFGQGALILGTPAAISNPFYLLAPTVLLLPMVALSTAATIIASQAVISGVFSVTQQCQQLGVLPPSRIVYSSEEHAGQVYVPAMNWLLCAITCGLVLGFGSSGALSGAYGIAVSGTMLIVTALMLLHEHRQRTRGAGIRLALLVALALVDVAFLVANLVKIPQGGWFPLLYGGVVLLVMRTWRSGRRRVDARLTAQAIAWKEFVALVEREQPRRTPGVAVFVESEPPNVPSTLVRNIRCNGVLHEHTILFATITEPVPRVSRGQRLEVERLEFGIRRVTAHLGYMESPDLPQLLHSAERLGLGARARDAFYVVEREDVIVTAERGMARWRKYLFLFLCRNARGMAARLRIPPDRGISLGGQVAV